jgi:hypothetical protein
MNPLQKTMLSSAVLAAVTVGAPGAARADAFAQSILVIDNFRLLHANGTPYTASDFSMLSGGVAAYASGQLNGVADSDSRTGAGNLDIAQRGVGALGGRLENYFAPLPGGGGASFGAADQHMAGEMITTNAGAAGMLVQHRADASVAANGAALGYSGVADAASFSFSLGVGEYMTIAFDALAFTQAFATDRAGVATSANASLSWTISVTDLTTGATVFAFQPEQLNALSNVSRTNGFGGTTTYAPGWLSFGATTSMLEVGDVYQISIGQGSFASALQSQQVPEPATLAGFGAGLLAMAALSRRRRGRAAAM